MRKGINPSKLDSLILRDVYHRVVIPVYIPNLKDDYFNDALEIFKICINSILKTIHKKSRVTIFNNNSCKEVKSFIDYLYKNEKQIDQIFHSKENVGKINAILSSVKGNIEPLITITDSDILFKQNWQREVEHIFKCFKNAGMVSPVPQSKSYLTHTAVNWYYGIFKGKIKFRNVINPNEMKMFDDSLGNNFQSFDKIHLEKYLTISNKKGKAVMGCGHFVATLRREVFDLGSKNPDKHKISSESDTNFIDYPNEKLGLLRLATLDNFAYHMGNTFEDWMLDKLNQIKKSEYREINPKNLKFIPIKKHQLFIGKVIRKILKNKRVKNFYFKYFLKMKVDY